VRFEALCDVDMGNEGGVVRALLHLMWEGMWTMLVARILLQLTKRVKILILKMTIGSIEEIETVKVMKWKIVEKYNANAYSCWSKSLSKRRTWIRHHEILLKDWLLAFRWNNVSPSF
jgi:hypothetical protein